MCVISFGKIQISCSGVSGCTFLREMSFKTEEPFTLMGLLIQKKKIPDLISNNTIHADMPNPFLEPELFQLVTTYQIHRCVGEKCGDPGTDANPCKKGFPQPLSNFTYCNENSKRYIYRRTKDEDRWVVPYHPETLLIWQGHINFQYITTGPGKLY